MEGWGGIVLPAVATMGSKLLIAGGLQEDGDYDHGNGTGQHSCCAKLFEFDTEEQRFTSLPDLESPRQNHAAVVVNNKLFVVGGLRPWRKGDEGAKLDFRCEGLTLTLTHTLKPKINHTLT
jgi:hypothetical protein